MVEKILDLHGSKIDISTKNSQVLTHLPRHVVSIWHEWWE